MAISAERWEERWENELRFTVGLAKRINHLERWLLNQGWMQDEQEEWFNAEMEDAETTETSSVPTSGRVLKPYTSCHASLEEIQRLIAWGITGSSRSMPSTELEFSMVTWPDSSTLQLTLRWPSSYGVNPAGNLGHAGHEDA
jgi:hypothetical protein